MKKVRQKSDMKVVFIHAAVSMDGWKINNTLAAFILLTGLINNVETDGESNVAIDDIPGEIVNVTENNAFSLK